MVIYDKYDIVFQEIPDEVSLAFTLKGCQFNCDGCHSPHLREPNGEELTFDKLINLIFKYDSSITNILFLGEGNDKDSLLELMGYASQFKKVSLYSGRDIIDKDYLPFLTYYKVGSYKKELGGLNSPATNQRLYKLEAYDITYKFQED